MKAKKLFVSPNDYFENFEKAEVESTVKLRSLYYVEISYKSNLCLMIQEKIEYGFVSDDQSQRGFGGRNLLENSSERTTGVFLAEALKLVENCFCFWLFYLQISSVPLEITRALVSFLKW